MADSTPKLYEGMFLMTQGSVTAGIESALDIVRGMLERAGAEIIHLYRWEERELAYPIAGQKRGTFLLTHFNAPPQAIAAVERECNLSEDVLRVMMTRADYMGDVEMEQAKKRAEGLPVEENAEGSEAPAATETPAATDA